MWSIITLSAYIRVFIFIFIRFMNESKCKNMNEQYDGDIDVMITAIEC